MDPDEALRRMRDLCTIDGVDPEKIVAQFQELDEWLTKGGFLPEAWARAHPAGGAD